MPISAYQASVPVFNQMLRALSAVLDKAAAAPGAGDFPDARLAPDMLPLSKQVQIATDHAKGATARLSGMTVPSFEDTETTLPELKQRIAKTLDFIGSVDAASFDGGEARDVSLKIGGHDTTMGGSEYLLHFALPNFFFHVTTAYDILRHKGVPIGKPDFMGRSPGR